MFAKQIPLAAGVILFSENKFPFLPGEFLFNKKMIIGSADHAWTGSAGCFVVLRVPP
jgi:hypothetical protein